MKGSEPDCHRTQLWRSYLKLIYNAGDIITLCQFLWASSDRALLSECATRLRFYLAPPESSLKYAASEFNGREAMAWTELQKSSQFLSQTIMIIA